MVILNSQFISSISCISGYIFRFVYRAILKASLQIDLYVQLLVLWKLRDLVLQIVVKYIEYIIKKKVHMWYFTYWVSEHNKIWIDSRRKYSSISLWDKESSFLSSRTWKQRCGLRFQSLNTIGKKKNENYISTRIPTYIQTNQVRTDRHTYTRTYIGLSFGSLCGD